MADISMCLGVVGGKVCNRLATCYRHTAPPNKYRQSYIVPPCIGASCSYYIPDDADAMRTAIEAAGEEL